MPITYYKVLGPNGECYHGGHGAWHLPKGNRPGKWMPKIKNIEPCVRGYHLVTIDQLSDWFGPEIWLAEGRGEFIHDTNKSVFEQARLLSKTLWDEQRARLFAADCAEHVLHVFLKQFPNDKRLALAIRAIRDFAWGKISKEQLAVAGDAARAAAWDAAWAAAEAAARAAARAAAWDAAWAAAEAVARAAAGAAAWAAARAAAGAVAWAAAEAAAGAAAGAAAEAAAGAVAWDAAWAAERKWQIKRLKYYLTKEDLCQ